MKKPTNRDKRIAKIVTRAVAPFANKPVGEPELKAMVAAVAAALEKNGFDPAAFDITFFQDQDGIGMDVSEKGEPN
jgi:hypothetical protein